MKASELRLGNWVECLSSTQQVQGVKMYGDCSEVDLTAIHWIDDVDIKPIPLTEEWLLKFGFDDNDLTFINNGLELSWLIRMCESGERSCFYLSDNFPEDFQIRVEYVHTLQNLYFALTGEELTIKE